MRKSYPDDLAPESPFGWLLRHARSDPTRLAVQRWSVGAVRESLTFGELLREVDSLARHLRAADVRPGDRVVLCLANEPRFFVALLAVIRLGATAVPAPVPTASRPSAFEERLVNIMADCSPSALVTVPDFEPVISGMLGRAAADVRMMTLGRLPALGGGSDLPSVPDSSAPAILQYTSGSTRRPRGVMVTHSNLGATCRQAAVAYREGVDDMAVTWVPLYHDMGMITGVMRPLFSGYCSTLLTPEEFIRDPSSWFAALSACRGTLSSAPNFAYAYSVRKVRSEDVPTFDLSRWRVARNAGEVVRPETVDLFGAHFAAAGFDPASMCPSYGLAEATLAMTTCDPSTRPLRVTVDLDDLERGVVTPRDASTGPVSSTRELISSGVASDDAAVRVDAGSGRVGEIHILGPQVSPGYWSERDDPVMESPASRWRATGDVGFIHEGHLFVLGRIDDTLVVNGRNYYMSDIDAACAGVRGIRRGRLAVFAIHGDHADKICVVAELTTDAAARGDIPELRTAVRRELAVRAGIHAAVVDFVQAGELPVTTSGKIRVSQVRRLYEAGRLPRRRGRGITDGMRRPVG